MRPFKKILIANRGEIALRVARTCREMGIATVAVHSTADASAPFVAFADEAVCIGPPPSRRSYLYMPSLIEAALRHGADAVHPGYGFLSEDADFARVCAEHRITFIGPTPEVMERVADKAKVRALMAEAGLPVLPGSPGQVASAAEAERIAGEVTGYPVVVKAVAGGGGRGIAVAGSPAELRDAYRETVALARSLYGNGEVYLERYLPSARHVEVQVLCDRMGGAVHLGERDCSLQRRNQKLVEEAPAFGLSHARRAELGRHAVRGALSVGYTGAGTFEFLLAPDGTATFMEINARIQVEHPVTEMITGLDLVREQIRVAAGEPLGYGQDEVRLDGAAVECRINAEDPDAGFRPTPGPLTTLDLPGGPGVRIDSGFVAGGTVPPYYDPLIAKLVAWGRTREQAIARAERALAETVVAGPGVRTTVPLLRRLLADPTFAEGSHTTRFVTDLLNDAL
ncbi:acetyl-CoA carboxylase biotin carboxylase subunit [Spongiactinospora sp. TRM90649]|uniref:acetyl-CoA carboxylase biotin carboxylase subunit n=1 Tax=Spongiactinospora sp. TRM90649 TaxID=3031114 RepID=UPI0023F83881|nr:acetyl-CoA carboxylase biotin carboxylase subunit [Spongiactinospora sp. TRM90649]MDF5755376.1 acetyl-CoA carboxylase biotin carboxylase subunit [Spongiactinospora sp. TRM90649]